LAVRRVGLVLDYLGPVGGSVPFPAGRASITSAHRRALDPVGQALSKWPVLRVKITGARQRGEAEALAARRAESVAGYLRSRWGVGGDRIEMAPLVPGASTVSFAVAAPDVLGAVTQPGVKPAGVEGREGGQAE